MEITIKATEYEKRQFIKDAAAAEDFCFMGRQNQVCSWNLSCEECIAKNINWVIIEERACVYCGALESKDHLLVSHQFPYIGDSVLICPECVPLVNKRAAEAIKEVLGEYDND